MVSKAGIERFLGVKKIALSGVSRDPKKFGTQVLDHLVKLGYEVYPVHPHADTISKVKVFRDISSLPPDCGSILIMNKKDKTDQLVREAVAKGITHIWIQQMSETKTALEFARENQVNLVYRQCIFMFTEPVKGVHKFHRFFKRLSPSFPR